MERSRRFGTFRSVVWHVVWMMTRLQRTGIVFDPDVIRAILEQKRSLHCDVENKSIISNLTQLDNGVFSYEFRAKLNQE